MRKLFLFLLLLLFLVSDSSISQIKQRSSSINVYTGIGYKFVYLTDPNASDAYPFFQLSNGDFLKEINGFFGVTLNEQYGIEFSPSYLFTNKNGSEGFYYGTGANRYFYVPVQTRLSAVPVNLRFKFYPFAKDYSSSFSKMYLGIGGGMMYISEEIQSERYTDDTQFNPQGIRTAEDSFWTHDFEFLLGIGSFSKLGFGFELSYRLVPLDDAIESNPLITYIASNFNSINLAANIVFSF
ncbi:MAG: hypothetical protein IPL53_25280 [Ignavibacteria bacterium]|nr:hypothetical protein [Ignavibacteria bacterium]